MSFSTLSFYHRVVHARKHLQWADRRTQPRNQTPTMNAHYTGSHAPVFVDPGSDSADDDSFETLIEARNKEIQNIHVNWFTDPALNDDMWSTNWDDFELIKFWIDRTSDGQLKIDKLLKETWVVPGTIEMLAYIPYCPDSYFLFAAGGEYYFWADFVLKKHTKKFASHQEFVDYTTKAELSVRASRFPDLVVPQAVESDFMWFFR
ncbi:hypothetical protein FB45DRAFT_942351 [Roridomyces roridus]|uniref:Uncharacterized protein n=1 Tax=Roridomyces roridus TaxID=1738132 RepID=A0AAD7B0X3_9AGAR|nr:hypothetical protein FB45DRAFT_435670 [Roridomyces roridus]KAJ7610355.1 hypothetical protein FB45DRAFT_942351 [Roridomyces roridus]